MEVKKIMEMNQQSVHDYANVIKHLDGSTTNKLLHEVGVFNENSCIIKYSEKAITNLLNAANANSTDLTVSIEGGKMDYMIKIIRNGSNVNRCNQMHEFSMFQCADMHTGSRMPNSVH